MGKDDALKTAGTLSLREKLKQAETLARKLERLDRRHDAKCRKLESKYGNLKLDVASWLSREREALLAAADPEARALVLAEPEPKPAPSILDGYMPPDVMAAVLDPDPLPAIGGVEVDRATGKTRRV